MREKPVKTLIRLKIGPGIHLGQFLSVLRPALDTGDELFICLCRPVMDIDDSRHWSGVAQVLRDLIGCGFDPSIHHIFLEERLYEVSHVVSILLAFLEDEETLKAGNLLLPSREKGRLASGMPTMKKLLQPTFDLALFFLTSCDRAFVGKNMAHYSQSILELHEKFRDRIPAISFTKPNIETPFAFEVFDNKNRRMSRQRAEEAIFLHHLADKTEATEWIHSLREFVIDTETIDGGGGAFSALDFARSSKLSAQVEKSAARSVKRVSLLFSFSFSRNLSRNLPISPMRLVPVFCSKQQKWSVVEFKGSIRVFSTSPPCKILFLAF